MNVCCWSGGFRLNNGSCSGERRMNPDFVDLLRAFAAADVRFLIVGAYALAHHGFIGREAFLHNKRATGRAKDLGDIEGL